MVWFGWFGLISLFWAAWAVWFVLGCLALDLLISRCRPGTVWPQVSKTLELGLLEDQNCYTILELRTNGFLIIIIIIIRLSYHNLYFRLSLFKSIYNV